MKVDYYTKIGKKAEQKEVSEAVFGIKPNEALLTQYLYIYQTNQRQGTSKVKTRGEVSGGGKKPWRQKGTGRARHGSIRSPIWRHGGITHGPLPKSWKLNFPKKMRRLAIKSALSFKAGQNHLSVIETPSLKTPSVKKVKKILDNMDLHDKVLFVQAENDKVLRKSLENIKQVSVSLAGNLNVYEVLLANNIVLTEDALKELEAKYEN